MCAMWYAQENWPGRSAAEAPTEVARVKVSWIGGVHHGSSKFYAPYRARARAKVHRGEIPDMDFLYCMMDMMKADAKKALGRIAKLVEDKIGSAVYEGPQDKIIAICNQSPAIECYTLPDSEDET